MIQLQVVTKWGNSLGVRIPRALANQIELTEGMQVGISIVDGKLVIQPEHRHKYTLDELLDGMTSENCHIEVDLGEPVGNEIW
jgi:antitoxin MazE